MSNVKLYLSDNQFYSGSVVTGKAVCNFRRRIDKVRKIIIRLKGHESTHWTETESYYDSAEKKDKSRTVSYNGSRQFLLKDNIVRGEGAVDMGEYVYPFEFLLPEDLPNSYHHPYGKIRYSVKVTVDIPMKFDYESEKDIIIISPIKLQNLSLAFLEPVEYSDEKTVCCFCCASGPVQLDVKLKNRAFLIGQKVNVEVSCSNMSNTNVDSIKAEIKQKLHFKTTSPASYRSDSELVATSRDSGVGAHGEKTFNLILEIPPSTVLPNFSGCELFSSDIKLKVTAVIHGCHSNIDIKTNVILGHIPHPQQTVSSYSVDIQPMPMQHVNDFQPMPIPPVNYFQPMPMPPVNDFQPMPMPPVKDFQPMPMPSVNEFQPMPMPPVNDFHPMPMPPVNDFQPMPMSLGDIFQPLLMPVPSYENHDRKSMEVFPYPAGPSAPPYTANTGAPSAPQKLGFITPDLGAGNLSGYEAPPPTYEEAFKK